MALLIAPIADKMLLHFCIIDPEASKVLMNKLFYAYTSIHLDQECLCTTQNNIDKVWYIIRCKYMVILYLSHVLALQTLSSTKIS